MLPDRKLLMALFKAKRRAGIQRNVPPESWFRVGGLTIQALALVIPTGLTLYVLTRQQQFETEVRKNQQTFESNQQTFLLRQKRIDEKLRIRSQFSSHLVSSVESRRKMLIAQLLSMMAATRDEQSWKDNMEELKVNAARFEQDFREIDGALSIGYYIFGHEVQEAIPEFLSRKPIQGVPFTSIKRAMELFPQKGEQVTDRLEKLSDPTGQIAKYQEAGGKLLRKMGEEIASDLELPPYNKR